MPGVGDVFAWLLAGAFLSAVFLAPVALTIYIVRAARERKKMASMQRHPSGTYMGTPVDEWED